jgi:hypothetical protein
MKNLLNCHSIGLHSFPMSLRDNGTYKRVFYADYHHELWKPVEIAIHPHHVDIKITVLDGELYNPLYKLDDNGELYKEFVWSSHILNGKGGFTYLGEQSLKQLSNIKYKQGESVIMRACEMHTVQIEKGKKCVWLIEESLPTCDYLPINYSKKDLNNWTPDGLYIECDHETRQKYIYSYIDLLRLLLYGQ